MTAKPSPTPTRVKLGSAPITAPVDPDVAALAKSLGNIGSTTTTPKSVNTWDYVRQQKFDVTGLNIPGHPTGTMTGDEVLQALDALANKNPSLWGQLRPNLYNSYPQYYNSKNIKVNWSTGDSSAIKMALTGIASTDSVYGTVTPIASLLKTKAVGNKNNGTAFSNAVTKPVVPLPATADLTQTAQDAFTKVLGRQATPQEADSFAKQFQHLVLSYGQDKANAKSQKQFQAPANPLGVLNPNSAGSVSAMPSASAVTAIEQPPTASVAAGNYAAKLHPTDASAQALSDALGNVIKNIGG